MPIAAACAPYGITCRCTANEHPVYMDKNGKVVQAMVSIYREYTGDPSEPTVIGGAGLDLPKFLCSKNRSAEAGRFLS